MKAQGIRIRAYRGSDIPPGTATLMYRYYLNTNARYGPWAARYLESGFFEAVFRHCSHRLLIMAAHHPSMGRTPLALSMLLTKNRGMMGRYWGCAQPVRDLHFNMCYYAPIRWAIENGMETFDPGAGSVHKIKRGFRSVANTSLHRFHDPRMAALFRRFIGEVNRLEFENIRELNRRLPLARKMMPPNDRVPGSA
jgi:predicted N-acyltransferase